MDFAGPYTAAPDNKKFILVSTDHYSSWPSAIFLRNTSTEGVLQFLKRYIADNGIPNTIRTDRGTSFTGQKFKTFCLNNLIEHKECPRADHKGNGKVERLIRTINERLKAEPSIIRERKNKAGLDELIHAL